jgi:hypothetical protein
MGLDPLILFQASLGSLWTPVIASLSTHRLVFI